MQKCATVLTLCAGLGLLGCDDTTEPSEPTLGSPQLSHARGGNPNLTGGGHNRGSNLDIKFAFSAVQKDSDGTASGHLRFSVVFQGELVEFQGRVICVTFDPENHRAWVGGVITQNNSTHELFTRDVNDVGRDIWFRAVDYGEGSNASQVDRTTFVGFEGNAGIITSEEYCDLQIWPEGDERTNPVTQGNISVHVPG